MRDDDLRIVCCGIVPNVGRIPFATLHLTPWLEECAESPCEGCPSSSTFV